MLDKIEMLLTSYDLEMYTTKLLLEKVLIYIESQIQGKEQRGKALLKAAFPPLAFPSCTCSSIGAEITEPHSGAFLPPFSAVEKRYLRTLVCFSKSHLKPPREPWWHRWYPQAVDVLLLDS